jgi:hypothetical protein
MRVELMETYAFLNNSGTGNSIASLNRSFASGIGLVLGFRYKFNDKFNISAEIIPTLDYTYSYTWNSNQPVSKNNAFSLSGNTSEANLTLAYRF